MQIICNVSGDKVVLLGLPDITLLDILSMKYSVA